MSASSQTAPVKAKYDPEAYRFVYEALHYAQQKLNRVAEDPTEEESHITGQELAQGAREVGIERYGLLARNVFSHWGIRSTADFGRIVFDMIDRGEMRKTDRDQLSDFYDVYDFDQAFDRDYEIVIDRE